MSEQAPPLGNGKRLAAWRMDGWRRTGWTFLVLWLCPVVASAQPADGTAGQGFSGPFGFVLLAAMVGLLPFAFMALTAFVKISTVLQIVRGAIGAPNVPTNAVVMALAVALTLLAMAPVGSRILKQAGPLLEDPRGLESKDTLMELVTAVREPMRGFLGANASLKERRRFLEIARAARPAEERQSVGETDLIVLAPAFVVTELLEAFSLGFALFLPFLVIDLVIANVLIALGMQLTSPNQVSLPFKLLLFVAIDGWGLLAQALVVGYQLG